MNRKLYKIVIIVAIGIICLFLTNGCHHGGLIIGDQPTYRKAPPPPPPRKAGPPPWAPAHGHRAKYHYRYYPSSYVYFDTGRGLYFYYDGGDWQASVSLPTWIHIGISDCVTLEMGTARPYEYHHEVIKKYPPGQEKKKYKGKGKCKGNGKWS